MTMHWRFYLQQKVKGCRIVDEGLTSQERKVSKNEKCSGGSRVQTKLDLPEVGSNVVFAHVF